QDQTLHHYLSLLPEGSVNILLFAWPAPRPFPLLLFKYRAVPFGQRVIDILSNLFFFVNTFSHFFSFFFTF
ncbi:MAG: hypothetical protein IIW10_02175, partial [Spirochaetaceae bacterium]|nr:hypothetical protein [Spirochaetaceae bacterium]